jgi:hypothetical protein
VEPRSHDRWLEGRRSGCPGRIPRDESLADHERHAFPHEGLRRDTDLEMHTQGHFGLEEALLRIVVARVPPHGMKIGCTTAAAGRQLGRNELVYREKRSLDTHARKQNHAGSPSHRPLGRASKTA